MQSRNNTVTDVPSYIAGFPAGTAKLLKQFRDIIRKATPEAEELISYGMPAYKYHGVLVYFAGYEKHVGFYPTPSVIKEFAGKISRYKYSKGAVQFPLDEPIPVSLVTQMVKFRMKENLAKTATKKRAK
ncbi:MAG: DUF1801 domain-containing protein [Bacteroidetes bacterium]|nr:DUF1801 domain-containing protein [Bacteroidota bacterium]